MKRYMLFSNYYYYSSGGFLDFVDSYDSFEEAEVMGKQKVNSSGGQDEAWYHIVDGNTGSILTD